MPKQKKFDIKKGHCPKCDSPEMDYSIPDWRDGAVEFPFTCLKCGFSGRETYSMDFQGYEGEDTVFYSLGMIVQVKSKKRKQNARMRDARVRTRLTK